MFDMPPMVPPGFNGPATLNPVLNGVVIGHTSTGMPWFAVPAIPMPWQVPPRPPTSTSANTFGPITLSPEMAQFTTAISEAALHGTSTQLSTWQLGIEPHLDGLAGTVWKILKLSSCWAASCVSPLTSVPAQL